MGNDPEQSPSPAPETAPSPAASDPASTVEHPPSTVEADGVSGAESGPPSRMDGSDPSGVDGAEPSGVEGRRPRRLLVGVSLGVAVALAAGALAWGVARATGHATGPVAGTSAAPSVVCNWLPRSSGSATASLPPTVVPASGRAIMTLTTNLGTIRIAMDRARTPCTVASLAYLAGTDVYTNSTCDRLVTLPGIGLLQCGAPSGTHTGDPGYGWADEAVPTPDPSLSPPPAPSAAPPLVIPLTCKRLRDCLPTDLPTGYATDLPTVSLTGLPTDLPTVSLTGLPTGLDTCRDLAKCLSDRGLCTGSCRIELVTPCAGDPRKCSGMDAVLPRPGPSGWARYRQGVVAMADDTAGDGHGGQFFMVYADSTIPPAYTEFGTVVEGMDVLRRVADAGSDQSISTGYGHPTMPLTIGSVTVTQG